MHSPSHAPAPELQTLESAAVVGGKGGMGRLFLERLNACGLTTSVLDKPLDRSLAEAVLPGADLVLLAVPRQALTEVLAQIGPFLGPGSILADICSVKVKPLQELLETHTGPVVGTHPLFGPQPEAGAELRIALVEARSRQAFALTESLMAQLGFRPFETSAAEHDRAMAFIQGLNFVTSASYLAAVSRIDAIERFMTPSFSRRLAAARKMLTHDAGMFLDLFESNPYSQDAVRQFRSMLNLAAAGELDLLTEKAGWWWRGRDNGGGMSRQS